MDSSHVGVGPLRYLTSGKAASPTVLVRWPPWATDVALSLVVLGLSVWSEELNNYTAGRISGLAGVLITVVASLALLIRRRFPVTVVLLTLAAHLTTITFLPAVAAVYALGAYGRNRLVVWGVTLAAILADVPWSSLGKPDLSTVLVNLAVNVVISIVLPLVAGLYMAARRALLAGWVDRAERAEREQAMIAERARAEERTRIAREMHDVVAHQVSLIVVHSGALQTIAARDPEQAVRAAETIQSVGRQALDELRHMIGVLRVGAPDDTDVVQRPQPKLQEVTTLVDASREAGLDVVLRVIGDRRKLPDRTERAVYRVVQEALTNVHKHAGGSSAEVVLTYEPQQLGVTVTNTPPPTGFQRSLPSGGQGLIGLTERAELVGGSLDINPLPDGGFRVSVRVPTDDKA